MPHMVRQVIIIILNVFTVQRIHEVGRQVGPQTVFNTRMKIFGNSSQNLCWTAWSAVSFFIEVIPKNQPEKYAVDLINENRKSKIKLKIPLVNFLILLTLQEFLCFSYWFIFLRLIYLGIFRFVTFSECFQSTWVLRAVFKNPLCLY